MTDGLIMMQPFASMIADGKKTTEYRDSKPPDDKLNVPIYILSKGKVYAKVIITSYFRNHGNDTRHGFDWNLKLVEKYKHPLRYNHPNGAQKWVKAVTLK